MKSDPYYTPYTKIISKLIKGLTVRHKTVKLLGENIEKKLLNFVFVTDF